MKCPSGLKKPGHWASQTALRFYATPSRKKEVFTGVEKAPDQRIFELTSERLSVQPVEMIFLDDVEVHVKAARAFGIHAILFQETSQAIADIQACLQAHTI